MFTLRKKSVCHRGTFPSVTPSFQVGKNLENRKIHQRRRSAWVGQTDFGKLELNNRNHSGNCQRLSAKGDQFEDIWNNRRNLWTDETATTLRHFNVFTKTLFMRALHKLIILRHFNVFYGNRRANYRTVYSGKYCHRLVILRAKCSLHSQALYFLSLFLPSYWNWERWKTILWSDDEEFMFCRFSSQMCQKQRQLTPTSSYWCDPLTTIIICFIQIVHEKWCFHKSVRQTENGSERGFVKHRLNCLNNWLIKGFFFRLRFRIFVVF